MKCSVCGTESKQDARVCPGCGATLIVPKADETMLDLRTALFRRPVIVSAAPPAPPPAVAKPATPGAVQGTPPEGAGIAGLVLVIVAVGVIGYFLYQVAVTFGTSSTGSSPGGATSAAPVGTPVPPAPLKPPAPEPVPGPPPAASGPAPAAQPTPVIAQVPVPASASVAAEPKPAPVAPPAPVIARVPVPASKSVAAEPKPAPAPAPQSPKKAVAPAPESKPARPDRWQDMKEATARCRRENLVSRTVCEQRVLFLYCDGYWGKVPECPEAQNPDPRK